MKNIHLIKTYKPSRLYEFGGQFTLTHELTDAFRNYHIYITNDEEIKEGDWVYCTERKLFGKVVEIQLAKFISDTSMLYFEIDNEEIWCKLSNCKKIILTDNEDLIQDGIQVIDDEFLEWLVKNPSCEEVRIENIPNNNWGFDLEEPMTLGYKIIIPKEEPKFKNRQIGAAGFVANKIMENAISEFKQETLEEDLKFPIIIENGLDYLNLTTKIFNNGAKWQQKRSYSEEEVKHIIDKTLIECSDFVLADIPEWFEQFKKK